MPDRRIHTFTALDEPPAGTAELVRLPVLKKTMLKHKGKTINIDQQLFDTLKSNFENKVMPGRIAIDRDHRADRLPRDSTAYGYIEGLEQARRLMHQSIGHTRGGGSYNGRSRCFRRSSSCRTRALRRERTSSDHGRRGFPGRVNADENSEAERDDGDPSFRRIGRLHEPGRQDPPLQGNGNGYWCRRLSYKALPAQRFDRAPPGCAGRPGQSA